MPYALWKNSATEKGTDPVVLEKNGRLSRSPASNSDQVGAVCEDGPAYCNIVPPEYTSSTKHLILSDYDPKRRYRVGMEIKYIYLQQ